jgi:hypothetical protein
VIDTRPDHPSFNIKVSFSVSPPFTAFLTLSPASSSSCPVSFYSAPPFPRPSSSPHQPSSSDPSYHLRSVSNRTPFTQFARITSPSTVLPSNRKYARTASSCVPKSRNTMREGSSVSASALRLCSRTGMVGMSADMSLMLALLGTLCREMVRSGCAQGFGVFVGGMGCSAEGARGMD